MVTINRNFQQIISHGSRNVPQVALTFDDGPDEAYTPRLLKLLRQQEVKATFFLLGERCKQHPGLLKQILAEGHSIGGHSYDHPFFTKITEDETFAQIGKTNAVVNKFTNKRMRLFRFPYGDYNEKNIADMYSLGLFMIGWDVDTLDYNLTDPEHAAKMVEIVKETVKPGSIILCHTTVNIPLDRLEALLQIIKYVKEKGYRFVTVEQLLDIPPYMTNV